MNKLTNIVGHIPEEITIQARDPLLVGPEWEDLEADEQPEKHEARPAFVVDASNKKSIERAAAWVKQGQRSKDPVDVLIVEAAAAVPASMTRKNEPMAGVRVITGESRASGRDAGHTVFKVITPDGYYVDMRADVLIDSLVTDGVKAGGVLEGEYVWGQVRSQMKLVRVGSLLHKRLIAAGNRKEKPLIPRDELKLGTVYESRTGVKSMFLGFVSGYKLDIDTEMIEERSRHSFYTHKKERLMEARIKLVRKTMLWLEGIGDTDFNLMIQRVQKGELYWLKARDSHNYVTVVDTYSVPESLDYIVACADGHLQCNYKNAPLANPLEHWWCSTARDPDLFLTTVCPAGSQPKFTPRILDWLKEVKKLGKLKGDIPSELNNE